MADNEDTFQIEAQDQAFSSQIQHLPETDTRENRTTSSYHSVAGQEPDENEATPLLSRKSTTTSDPSPTSSPSISKPWTAFEGLPWYKKPSIYLLLPAFFPFCLAFGGLIVPRTYLILNLICEDYLSDRAAADPTFRVLPVMLGDQNEQCRDAHVQSLVARFQLYSALLAGVFSGLVSPYLGALSDRVGRVKIIAFSTIGLFLEAIIYIAVGLHPQAISVYWLLLGFFFDGVCGSFTTAMGVSLAYASDCTPPARRSVAIGYFYGTLFTGIAIGPIVAGFLMKWTGTLLIAFYFAVGCHLFFIIFLLTVTPESVSQDRQNHAREKHRVKKEVTQDESWWATITSYNILEPLSILRPRGPGTSNALRRNLSLLASIDTIMFGVAMGTFGIILIYPQYLFGWDPIQASNFLSISNICRVFSLFVVLPLIIRLVRGPAKPDRSSSGHHGSEMLDLRIIRVAILFDIVGYIGYATSKTGGMMVASAMVASFAGVGPPTLSSAITAHVPSDRTGQVLGALGLLHALARVIAPVIINTIYSLTVGKFTQAVFVCLGSVFLVVFVLSWFLKPGISYDDPDLQHAEQEDEGSSTAITIP